MRSICVFVLANACVTASVTTTISIADAELRRQSAEVAQRITHRSRSAGRCIVAPFFWSNG